MSVRDILMGAAGAASSGGSSDPKFNYVTMLLHGDGTNGAQNNTFVDSSANNFTITRNGNTTQGSFSPYGDGWSTYISGGSYQTVPQNAAFAFGTGDFTVEFWVNLNSYKTSAGGYYDCFVAMGSYTNSPYFRVLYNGTLEVSLVGSGLTGTTVLTKNVWHHVAVSRSGTTARMYLNGVLEATVTNSSNLANSSAVHIGTSQWLPANEYMDGHISNLRIVKGTALYTSTFTPSTTPLAAISGTSLLTCQSNRFKDNSSNAFAITTNGTPRVQRFNPFGLSTEYTTATIGGSGYFDGSGDYLTIGASANLQPASSDFCVEAWIYPTIVGGNRYIYSANDDSSGTNLEFRIYYSTSGVFANYYATSGYVSQLSTATPLVANQWSHIAWSRSGSTISLFVNGVRVATGSISGGSSASTAYVYVGEFITVANNQLTGYMGDLRFVKGSSVYTPSSTTLTVPTAPLTAVANTKLLLNYTNATIVDNAMMNDLETVGNAQISTSVKKYGTGSMYFDGSGDWLYVPTSTNFGFGTGDFTLECWVYPTSWSGTTDGFVSCERGASTVSGVQISRDGIEIGNNSSGSTAYAWSTSIPLNTWTHVAATRSNGTVRGFLNGVLSTTPATNTTDLQSTQACAIGRRLTDYGGYYMTGHLDDVRITKGHARYTANFTPPAAPLPNN